MDVDAVAQRVIAIDGTSGSGKSTVARAAAERLGFGYLDTGAMYRAYTWAALQGSTPWAERVADEVALRSFLTSVDVGISTAPGVQPVTVTLDGVTTDVTTAIRGAEVTQGVSAVAAAPAVRSHLVELQRRLAADTVVDAGGIVIEGRDIGSVVFTGAPVKVWLTASEQARGVRRAAEQTEAGAVAGPVAAETAAALVKRDALDASRTTSPARSADDAVLIDTTTLTVDEVVRRVLDLWRAADEGKAHARSGAAQEHGATR